MDTSSPTKKRKLMHTPNGFEKGDRDTARARVSAPKFASAFDDPRRSKLTERESPLRVHELSPAKVDPDTRALRVLRPPSPRLLEPPPQAGPSITAPSALVRKKPVHPHLRAMKFASTLSSRSNFTLKDTLSSPQNTPRTSSKPVLRAGIHEFLPVLPAPQPEPEKTIRTVVTLPPPPILPLPKGALADINKLRTLSTTRVAVMMDPRTESGTEELMALQLEQNLPTYIPPAERELNRGLGQSPEKASKAKGSKFLRGGLASRAQHMFTKERTSLTLWYKDMDMEVQKKHPLTPGLFLRIVEVIHVASIASLQRSQNVPRVCVVRCAKIIKERVTGDLTVLLDFGGPRSAAEKAHTLDDVKEGRDLQVWPPWKSSQADELEMRRYGAPPRDGTVMFCTRFRIT